ncbi:MAG: hypothetical protein J7502_19080, partial [Flavisolibacter sp.]|nr:hypothetical protein [Flavisolibacter sp.]
MSAEEVIPEHNKGIQTNTESSIELPTEKEAKDFYKIVRERLLHVNEWHQYAGSATADFQLTDDKGNPVERVPQKGDHFKIKIPGPGTVAGEGNDWVQIEEIEEDEDCIGIRVRPASNPTNEQKDVAHFFDEESTSSFLIKREVKKVTAGVYGRNEKPNTNTETVID